MPDGLGIPDSLLGFPIGTSSGGSINECDALIELFHIFSRPVQTRSRVACLSIRALPRHIMPLGVVGFTLPFDVHRSPSVFHVAPVARHDKARLLWGRSFALDASLGLLRATAVAGNQLHFMSTSQLPSASLSLLMEDVVPFALILPLAKISSGQRATHVL